VDASLLGVTNGFPGAVDILERVRDRPVMIGPRTVLAMASTDSRSPWLGFGGCGKEYCRNEKPPAG
jgi:hypothetical protein